MTAFDLERFIQSLDSSDWTRSGEITPATRQAYRNDVRRYLEWLAAQRIDVVEASHDEVQAFLIFLATSNKPSTVRRAASSLRRLYRYLDRPLPKGKGRRLQLPERTPPFSRALDRRSIDAVRDQLSGPSARHSRNRVMFELLFSSGFRVSELVALNRKEVRLKDHLIRPLGKANIPRVIPIGGRAEELLGKWLQTDRRRYLDQVGASANDDAVFLNRSGSRIARQSIQRIINAAGRNAGLGFSVAPHMIRDSCARLMLDNGATPFDVDLLFGHVTLIGQRRLDLETIARLRAVMRQTHPSWSG